jgi:hypothetical protein
MRKVVDLSLAGVLGCKAGPRVSSRVSPRGAAGLAEFMFLKT